jgi:hypothetical protein
VAIADIRFHGLNTLATTKILCVTPSKIAHREPVASGPYEDRIALLDGDHVLNVQTAARNVIT